MNISAFNKTRRVMKEHTKRPVPSPVKPSPKRIKYK
uniref:Uncharacterized protein n=1 Tax=Lepeophtheirus salmonis TaxID=72036 RepID=A0A0K2UYX4_LEPSM